MGSGGPQPVGCDGLDFLDVVGPSMDDGVKRNGVASRKHRGHGSIPSHQFFGMAFSQRTHGNRSMGGRGVCGGGRLFGDTGMTTRIVVTGAAGFVGRAVVSALLARGYHVDALVHKTGDKHFLRNSRLRITVGDVLDKISMAPLFEEKPAAVIQLVGRHIPVEATVNTLWWTKVVGAGHYIHMSALGASPTSRCRYHRRKAEAEYKVELSGVPWTTVRPSVVFGKGCDFVRSIESLYRLGPFVLLPGPGDKLLQPIHVDDVAAAVVSIVTKEPRYAAIEVGGPERWSLIEMIRFAGRTLGKSKPIFQLPPFVAAVVVRAHRWGVLGPLRERIYQGVTPERRLNVDHLELMREDNICLPIVESMLGGKRGRSWRMWMMEHGRKAVDSEPVRA